MSGILPKILSGGSAASGARATDYLANILGGAAQGAAWGAEDGSAIETALQDATIAGAATYAVPNLIARPARAVWDNTDEIAKILNRGMGL
jgi:hypothetical protein